MTEHGSESENPAVPAPEPKAHRPRTIQDWWPDQLDLSVLHQHSPKANPLGASFDYKEQFAQLDVEALKRDVEAIMTKSRGLVAGRLRPLRRAVHPDELALRRHLPHRRRSWRRRRRRPALRSAQQLAGQRQPRQGAPAAVAGQAEVRHEDLLGRPARPSPATSPWTPWASQTFGFAFGREDTWEPEEIFWGPEDTWLGDERYSGERELAPKLGAVQMGLIYVNPEGPNGNPDPLASARDIRETFRRMAMNDEETVALIAGGHSFGKTHGAAPADNLGPEPDAAPLEQQGFGWKNQYGSGVGRDAITSGLEVTWVQTPTRWSNYFFENLFGYEWELTESPAGAKQWVAKDAENVIPDPETGELTRKPTMLTSDLALRFDPAYERISRHFLEHPDEFADAFARAWYKLMHRDMGPVTRYLGPWVAEPQLWQDPVPAVDHELVGEADVATLKQTLLGSGPVGAPAGAHRLGFGVQLPRHGQARRRQRCPHPAGPAEGLGRQRAGRAGLGAADPGEGPAGLQRPVSPAASGSRWPT